MRNPIEPATDRGWLDGIHRILRTVGIVLPDERPSLLTLGGHVSRQKGSSRSINGAHALRWAAAAFRQSKTCRERLTWGRQLSAPSFVGLQDNGVVVRVLDCRLFREGRNGATTSWFDRLTMRSVGAVVFAPQGYLLPCAEVRCLALGPEPRVKPRAGTHGATGAP